MPFAAANTWCTGAGYRLPHVNEFTNANGSGWTGGLAGNGNNFKRYIGGGLFSEWGPILSYEAGGSNGGVHWTVDPAPSGRRFLVRTMDGGLWTLLPTSWNYVLCMTP